MISMLNLLLVVVVVVVVVLFFLLVKTSSSVALEASWGCLFGLHVYKCILTYVRRVETISFSLSLYRIPG